MCGCGALEHGGNIHCHFWIKRRVGEDDSLPSWKLSLACVYDIDPSYNLVELDASEELSLCLHVLC